jgi:hypothetical protein
VQEGCWGSEGGCCGVRCHVAGCLQPDWRGSGGQTAHGSLVPGCIHRSDDSGERPLLIFEET